MPSPTVAWEPVVDARRGPLAWLGDLVVSAGYALGVDYRNLPWQDSLEDIANVLTIVTAVAFAALVVLLATCAGRRPAPIPEHRETPK